MNTNEAVCAEIKHRRYGKKLNVSLCVCASVRVRAHDTVSARVSLTYMSVESCNNCKLALLSACKSKWLNAVVVSTCSLSTLMRRV